MKQGCFVRKHVKGNEMRLPKRDSLWPAYGEHADPKEILGRPGGKYAPARAFRKDLTQMVLHAWDIPPGSPTIAEALSGR